MNFDHEAMMAIGCIQAQRCHTNHCFAGVANPSSVVGAWSGSNQQSRAVRQLHHHAAEGRAGAESCVPGSASGAHYRGSLELLDDRVRFKDHRRTLWIWPRLWITVPDQLRGGASHHEIVTRFRRHLHGGGRMQDRTGQLTITRFSS